MTATTTQDKQEVATNFGPFSLAQNSQAFAKVGLLGFGGAGKTYTAAVLAMGIYKRLQESGQNPGPVVMSDTETGSDFLVPLFKDAGIPFYVSKSRAFIDLMGAVNAADGKASVLIIDSITHFWSELQSAYKKKLNRTRLQFQDWAAIKDQWGQFTMAYLNSNVHIIMLGRAGYEYDYFEDEDGKKQLAKTGTKMKAESEMGYEPSLLIEMVREDKPNQDKNINAKLWDHVAVVLKDRSQRLEGARLVNPGFNDFAPFFDYLNVGGNHVGVETAKDSTGLFDKNNEKNFYERKRRIEILKEEIEGSLTSAFPGQAAQDKKLKTDLFEAAFKTRSWTALDEKDPAVIQLGLEVLKKLIVEHQTAGKPDAEATKNGKGA